MALLLLLGYSALCVVAFRLLRAPVNQWTVTTAVIGEAVVVSGLLAGMNYNHPFTTDGRIFFYTTSIAPTVIDQVVEVVAEPNQPLKRGDVLFRIDPRPYRYIVDQKRAALAEAEQNVAQLRATRDQASAAAERAQAQAELAQQTHDRQVELLNRNVVAQATVDTAVRNLEASQRALAGARAAAERARLASSAEIDGVNTAVARLQAELLAAEYNLGQTTVTVPTDGYVTQMLLRPGMTVSPATPTMVFIHSHDVVFAASFPQTATARIRVDGEIEAAFDALPGRVLAGRVKAINDAISTGQLQSTGALINPEDRSRSEGRLTVSLELKDMPADRSLPPGSVAQVALYSDHWRPFAAIRRILLRQKSWLNYVL
ncbi:HlyD family secretion protein [Reyranella sp.]|uniref:HlyD family secretion protein n=1 Tax=Reyranella sp. TaxID=1929291 RepID=UPI003BA91885